MGGYEAKRGQVIVAGTLLVAILTLSLALSIYRMSGGKEELRATPVRETVLGITSDMDRALVYALSNASKLHRELWLNDTVERYHEADELGRSFLSTWKRSVLTAYSNLGIGLDYTKENFSFFWTEGFGSSRADCKLELSISRYGFTGWVADRTKAVGLRLYVESILPDQVTQETTLNFSLVRDANQPIPDLGPENLEIRAYIQDDLPPIMANVTSLEYRGEGNYTLTFIPAVNQISRHLELLVTTPDDQIIVAAYHWAEEQVRVYLNSAEQDNQSFNLGWVTLNQTTYSLPNSTYILPTEYMVEYVPEPGYSFLNWTIQNGSLARMRDNFDNPTSIIIEGRVNVTVFYSNEVQPGKLIVKSEESNGHSQGMGMVWLMEKLPGKGNKWEPLDGPKQMITYNLVQDGTYAVYFDPQPGYVFQKWVFTGEVGEGTGNPPKGPNVGRVYVGKSGAVATAIYTPAFATVELNSTTPPWPWVITSTNKGWIRFDSVIRALPNTTTCAIGTYDLAFLPQNPNQYFYEWKSAGDVFVVDGSSATTIARVQGDGSITAVYVEINEPPSGKKEQGPWDKLYVDQGYWLMPSWNWTGEDGKLSPSFSMGLDKQVVLLASPPTPELRIAKDLFVQVYVRPNPPNSVKEVTLELGFQTSDGANGGPYYPLGTATYPVSKDDVYTMHLDSTQAQFPGEEGIIPEGSTIVLWVVLTFRSQGWGTFFLYHGISWTSYVYLGGVPTQPST